MPPSIDMRTQLRTQPAPSAAPGRAASERCAALARERGGLRLRLAMATATFCALDGPAALGYSSMRDYARNGLGVPAVHLLRLRRVGALCASQPSVRGLSFSVLDLLAQRLDTAAAAVLTPRLKGRSYQNAKSIIGAVGDAASPTDRPSENELDPTADPDYQRVSFAVPAEVATYLHQTLELASAMLGQEVSEADAVDAVVAEASTEFNLTLEANEARRCFGIPTDAASTAKPRRRSPVAGSGSTASSDLTRPRFRRSDKAAAFVLDRYLRRLLSRERRFRTQLEDAILYVRQTEAHRSVGFASLTEFGRVALDMPPSTLSDYLDRALARRRDHPIATALADGALSAAKAQLLDRLHRRCHVPASCLPRWIELACTLSFRGLLQAIHWAQGQRDTNYRAWSNADFAPPTRERVRASKHSVTEIAANPTPEFLADATQLPSTTVQWVLRRETLDALLQLMASSRARNAPNAEEQLHHPDPRRAIPAWWCLLDVFVTTRRQWSVIEREPPGYRGRVLRRDDYRCVVPVCSQRRSIEVHHIRFRSAGRDDHPSNLASLCAFHHTALHDGRIRIRGRVHSSTDDLVYELAIDSSGRAGVRFKGEEVRR